MRATLFTTTGRPIATESWALVMSIDVQYTLPNVNWGGDLQLAQAFATLRRI